ncbi:MULTISPECIES: pirin-like C-terminal cupin domain-containing protein [Pseudomonadaceae]|uniref:pirin-like C-terminal cupin domain-containing protein n=1 Tax=Pseudomonadaceae TaxID=135621 RepID=UPI001C8C67F0|nr:MULTISPECIES: pirin-like C-terminal cupin domain-containing protein [Pseudomonadaceae]MCF6782490.1 hypothetical protein [Stutzerimonas stutzeri]MCF6805595.1 hypothetical protein [Stutzerimonas stutzeri]
MVAGEVEVVGQMGRFGADQLVLLRPGGDIIIRALKGARLVLLGGEPLEGSRHIYWNFVSSSRQERILQAAETGARAVFPGCPLKTASHYRIQRAGGSSNNRRNALTTSA